MRVLELSFISLLLLASQRAHAQATPQDEAQREVERTRQSAVAASAESASAPPATEPPSDPPPGEAPPALVLGGAVPASYDPGGYPPLRRTPLPRPLIEVHGFLGLWVTFVTDPSAPQHATETFRVRWAILRADAHPVPQVHVLTRLQLTLPNPLLDLSATWTELPFLNVTVGQFRMPHGAAATTLGPALVSLDRPTFVYQLAPLTTRDIGVMIHSGEEGLFDGIVHYRLVLAGGNGRVGVGDVTELDDFDDLLFVARVIFDVGGVTFGPGNRLALGASYARTQDPAIDTSDPQAARAAAQIRLGRTLAPYDQARETQLAGADLTLSVAGVWAQAELSFLDSVPLGEHLHRRAIGASLELAYTFQDRILDLFTLQVFARGEHFDPDLEQAGDDFVIGQLGLNAIPVSFVRVSLIGRTTFWRDAAAAQDKVGGELTARAVVTY